MSNTILLSICIPTYNRAGFLRNTLESITAQKGFDNRVEIVISDNCSTDNTSDVVLNFQKRFENIVYHCNEHNIQDKNFIMVLSLGKGLYLKLLNDTALVSQDSLLEILNIVEKFRIEQPVLFFANGTNKTKKDLLLFNDLNSFLKETSFYVTWIVTFGIWKKHFDAIINKYEGIELNLVQTMLLFKNISNRKQVLVISNEHFIVEEVKNKGGYNLINVFVGNYLGKIVFSFYKKNEITRSTYIIEKTKLLKFFLFPWLYRSRKINSEYRFLTKGSNLLLLKYYGLNPLFYYYMAKLNLKLFLNRYFNKGKMPVIIL